METEFLCARSVEVARAAFGCLLSPAAPFHSFTSAAGGELGRLRVQSRGVPLEAPA
jgi:hypothetical protein